MHTTADLPLAVIGAGITGLTAAWRLQQRGLRVQVYEASAVVGGVIRATDAEGWLHESGPNSLLENSPEITRFVDELGLSARRVYANATAKKRYIVRGARPIPLPTSPLGFARTPLFSSRAKLNLLGEPWRAPSAPEANESVAEFVTRRLGREFLDYAINPFVGGVYAGDPTQLSVRLAFPKLHALEQTHGSLIRGALRKRNTQGGPSGRIFSFRSGLRELPEALAATLAHPIQTGTRIDRIRRLDGNWEIEGTTNGRPMSARVAGVILALPADALARLDFEGVPNPNALRSLSAVDHPAVVSVFTGFRRSDVAHPLDGFGMLVPEVERRAILGTLFSSTLFPHRAPADHVALTTFVGGTRQPDIAALPDAELIRRVRADLGDLLGVTAEPVIVRLQRWPRAIPQYTHAHGARLAALREFEAGASGLFIGGNVRDGISVSQCIQSGERLAQAAAERIEQTVPV